MYSLSKEPKTLTFCNISVITEAIYIYLKLGICTHHPKSNPSSQGRHFKMHFFFSELCLRLYPLSSTPKPSVGRGVGLGGGKEENSGCQYFLFFWNFFNLFPNEKF